MLSHYDVLGVSRDASRAVIREAYKRKAMLHHPDRSNGDSETMQIVQKAYNTLSDPERRAHYDATGDSERPLTDEEKAAKELRTSSLALLRGAMIEVLTTVDESQTDVLKQVADLIKQARSGTQEDLDQNIKRKEKAQRTAKRVLADDATLVEVLAGLSNSLDGPIAKAQLDIAACDAALAILSGASYNFEAPAESGTAAEMQVFQDELLRMLASQMGTSKFGRRG